MFSSIVLTSPQREREVSQEIGRERFRRDGGQLAVPVRLVELHHVQPHGQVVAELNQLGLVRDAEKDESLGIVMPVQRFLRVQHRELQSRVSGLDSLHTGRQIAAGDQVELTYLRFHAFMIQEPEWTTGLEPATSSLASWCSTD
jgi:hypothetical protein